MLTATSPAPFTIGELRELDVPTPLAVTLSDKSRTAQVWVLRRLAGLPFRPSAARGLTVRVDKQDMVLSIDRR